MLNPRTKVLTFVYLKYTFLCVFQHIHKLLNYLEVIKESRFLTFRKRLFILKKVNSKYTYQYFFQEYVWSTFQGIYSN